jgi:predicted MFS family arabinose efflux permease
VLARRYVPSDEGTGLAGSLDVPGALLVTSALMLGVYTIVKPASIDGWTAGTTLAFGAVSVALLAGFIAREATAASPLMPLRIFGSRNVSGANVIQVVGAAGMYGTFFLGALYVQRVLHYSPLKIGFAFLPITIIMGTLSVRYSERLVMRFGGQRLAVVGLASIGLSLVLLTFAPVGGGYWLHLFPSFALMGLGAGLAFPPLMGLAMSDVAPHDAGLASGLVNTTAQVGGALGLAVLASVTSGRTTHLLEQGHSHAAALTGGYHLGFWISAGLVLIGVLVAATVLQSPVGVTADDIDDFDDIDELVST